MIQRSISRRSVLGLVISAAAFAAVPAAQSSITIVMTRLDNPRGLAIGPEGALYVAEAGHGGTGPCVFLAGVAQIRCYGPSGAVSRLWRGEQTRVLTRLPSHANAAGDATGPHDMSFQGMGGASLSGSEAHPTSVKSSGRQERYSARS